MISLEVRSALENYWKENKWPSIILNIKALSGGSINQAFYIETESKKYFLKYHISKAHPGMFSSELKGLKLIAKTHTIRIPQTFLSFENDQYSGILLEYIDQGEYTSDFWRNFALKLSEMHRASSRSFGLDFSNYMGSIQQSNKSHKCFVDFFIEERLEPQMRMARNQGLLSPKHIKQCEKLYGELNSIFPNERPSLVHGDLWSGNFICDKMGQAVIIDPAVYYGHRELDIAMTTMFGGFHPDFYQYYQQFYPMEKGWKDRLPVYNLYPILIHINLFGSSYIPSFERVISIFS